MTTILFASPEIFGPDFVTFVATSTPMYAGTVAGGFELFPGPVVQVMPHLGDSAESVAAKPLKLAGADPPLRWLSVDHCALQKVTLAPVCALWSPTTKAPLARNANRIVFALADAGR